MNLLGFFVLPCLTSSYVEISHKVVIKYICGCWCVHWCLHLSGIYIYIYIHTKKILGCIHIILYIIYIHNHMHNCCIYIQYIYISNQTIYSITCIHRRYPCRRCPSLSSSRSPVTIKGAVECVMKTCPSAAIPRKKGLILL
jgi:hypothetical protein